MNGSHMPQNCKYVVVLGDGMADWPISELGGKTPLERAKTPCFDTLAKQSVIGLVKTVPDGMTAGSDIANLSVLGYDPAVCHTGRSPLEAASIGVPMNDLDTTFRCNFVTLSDGEPFESRIMVDYSSGEITTKEAAELVNAMDEAFSSDKISFYTGTAYRHIMLWRDDAPKNAALTPPHDISGKHISEFLPGDEMLCEIVKKSCEILKDHPINIKRMQNGQNPGNCAWLWGAGKKTVLERFEGKYGLAGGVISAVDLVKGIARSAGMGVFEVEGATGNVDTNFEGKADMAIKQLANGYDFIYIHVEAPDECGHRGELDNKILSIERLDAMTGKIYDYLKSCGSRFRLMVLPDHPTPLEILTHSCDPVPFMMLDSSFNIMRNEAAYSENYAQGSGVFFESGERLMDSFLKSKGFEEETTG